MAGSYPDVPGPRLAYDLDGTELYVATTSNVLTQISGATLTALNDESDVAGVGILTTYNKWIVLFPQAMDLAGYYIYNGQGTPGVLEQSSNTTTGLDGTWTTVASPYIRDSGALGLNVKSRNLINAVTATNFTALRFNFSVSLSGGDFNALHLYGTPNAAGGDRLEIWNAAGSARLTGPALDVGNVPRSSSADYTFKVKNVSATKTATDVILSMNSTFDASPSVAAQYTFSLDGVTFTSTLNIGSLSAGAISSTITVRRVTPSNAVLGPWVTRIRAVPTTFA